MESKVIGFLATSASVIAFGSQFIYTLKTKTTTGISIYRTVFDVGSLTLWIAYAARLEDIPLLIATSCELFISTCLLIIILRHRQHRFFAVKDITPPQTPPKTEDSVILDVRPLRGNSI